MSEDIGYPNVSMYLWSGSWDISECIYDLRDPAVVAERAAGDVPPYCVIVTGCVEARVVCSVSIVLFLKLLCIVPEDQLCLIYVFLASPRRSPEYMAEVISHLLLSLYYPAWTCLLYLLLSCSTYKIVVFACYDLLPHTVK